MFYSIAIIGWDLAPALVRTAHFFAVKTTFRPASASLSRVTIVLSLSLDFLIAFSFFEHHKNLYSKPRLFFGGGTSCLAKRSTVGLYR